MQPKDQVLGPCTFLRFCCEKGVLVVRSNHSLVSFSKKGTFAPPRMCFI